MVGMSSCYPEPGSVKIKNEELLTVECKYGGEQKHTGVMGLFHIMVAHKLPKPLLTMKASADTNV